LAGLLGTKKNLKEETDESPKVQNNNQNKTQYKVILQSYREREREREGKTTATTI
jgi:hypothetical protein